MHTIIMSYMVLFMSFFQFFFILLILFFLMQTDAGRPTELDEELEDL